MFRSVAAGATRWLDSLWQDLRYGVRNLCRTPGLVMVSVLSLGLGIGLNLALYAGIDTIFRHRPTMADPDMVVGIEPGNGRQFSYLNYQDLQDADIFSEVMGFRIGSMNRGSGEDIERVSVLAVSGNFFAGLGIPTLLGRTFGAEEAAPEKTPRFVVLSHSYWSVRFAADPGILGQTLILDTEPFVVLGVLPASYRAVTGFMAPSVYVPLSDLTLPTLSDRGSPSLSVLARLRPGITRQSAQSAVTILGSELERRFPDRNEGLSRPAQVFAAESLQFRGTPFGFVLLPALLLFLFALVLLIGAANVAGLLLARAVSRQHELTIRAALGASRVRVMQSLLTESFLLSLLGAAAGLLLTFVLSRTDLPGPLRPLQGTLAPDVRLVAPALLLIALTTFLCGVIPALRTISANVAGGLRLGGLGTTSRLNLRGAVIVAQVAVSLTLLVVSSLCLRSQMRVFAVDVGFDLDHGVVTRFNLETGRDSPEGRLAFADRVVERLEQLPGVQSAAPASLVPLGGDALVASFHPAGRSDIPGTRPSTVSVGPRYFETMSIPVLRGREFDRSDRDGAPAVVIVNQTFAATYFPGQNGLGQRVEIGGEAAAEIVGVVSDSRIDTIGEAPKSVLYYAYAQRPRRLLVIARTSGAPAAALAGVRRAIAELDPTVSVSVNTLRDAASLELTMRRVGTQLVGAIGLVGLMLTAIGLYGVVAYLVASKALEMGIRMALGASTARLHWEVLRHALRLVGTGVAIGTAASLLLAPALATFLAGVSPVDPIAFAGAALLLMLVALAASYLPARGVARVDPMLALRR
jgi:predicted permease